MWFLTLDCCSVVWGRKDVLWKSGWAADSGISEYLWTWSLDDLTHQRNGEVHLLLARPTSPWALCEPAQAGRRNNHKTTDEMRRVNFISVTLPFRGSYKGISQGGGLQRELHTVECRDTNRMALFWCLNSKFYPFIKKQPWKFSTKLNCSQLETGLSKRVLSPSDKLQAILSHRLLFFFEVCVYLPLLDYSIRNKQRKQIVKGNTVYFAKGSRWWNK